VDAVTRKQLDRALLKMFNVDGDDPPRCQFPNNLYDYAWGLWARSKRGRAVLAARGKRR